MSAATAHHFMDCVEAEEPETQPYRIRAFFEDSYSEVFEVEATSEEAAREQVRRDNFPWVVQTMYVR